MDSERIQFNVIFMDYSEVIIEAKDRKEAIKIVKAENPQKEVRGIYWQNGNCKTTITYR